MSPRPDFFIVGAAKCGTTALFRYLAAHPAVFMPESKEPEYFCTDLPRDGHVATLAEYEALFATAQPNALTGEASVMYLYSKVAIGQIMAHNADAKIIAILRNPIEAARSMHAFQWDYGLEDVSDFERAWRLQKPRREGQHLPSRWPHPEHLQYGELYCYASQVRRLLAQVPRMQCLFLIFEEFFADPSREFARLLEFLGLSPILDPDGFPGREPDDRDEIHPTGTIAASAAARTPAAAACSACGWLPSPARTGEPQPGGRPQAAAAKVVSRGTRGILFR